MSTITPATTEPRGLIPEGKTNELLNWYFAVNGPGLRKEFDFIKVAVTSARLNTTLRPHCIYDGEDCAQLEWLTARGVDVIRHRPSLRAELRAGYGEKYKQFNGHWLRVDLPRIDRKSRWALYTDIDVMFMADPRLYHFNPRYLAVCEEHKVGVRTHFNSGSMVLNLARLRNVYPWFIESIRERLNGPAFAYPPHDQRSFNDFFIKEAEWMQPVFNWKPYWGYNEQAVIVHFHGPKPKHVRNIKLGQTTGMKAAYVTIHDRNPEGYERYLRVFDDYLALAEQ